VRIVVTGAAGFIGAHLCAQLVRNGHHVTGIDNFSQYYSRDLKSRRAEALLGADAIEIVELDVKDFAELTRILKSSPPDLIIHLSAQAGIRLPISQVESYVLENNLGHVNITKAALELGIPNLIYASSSSVYGNTGGSILSENLSQTNPISVYGVSKLANEKFTHAMSSGSSLKAIGLRFFTVYGPWGRPDMAYFRLINSSLNQESFPLMGAGSVVRDFTFIDDVAIAISKIAIYMDQQKHPFSNIFNVGGGSPTSLQGMIEVVSKLTKKEIKIEQLSRNLGDVDSTWCDKSKLESILGSHEFVDLQNGLSKTVEWAMSEGIRAKLPEWVNSVG
jgi:UDP-glucuronate 4-epimerase